MPPKKIRHAAEPAPPPDAYDSAWKEAVGKYFPELLALLFPAAFAQIDWSRPPEQLDTELRKVIRESPSGESRADLLFKVFLKDGSEGFVLAHVEIQTTRDSRLGERMFRYCHRIFDRYRHFVAAFVILGDEHPGWVPASYSWEVLGSKLSWQFETAKLLDWEKRWPELVASSNPFAAILMSHIRTKTTRKNPSDRLEWKLRITEHIYANHPGETGRELLRLVDWMMQLPPDEAIIYEEELQALDAEKNMSYIPSFARKSWNEGQAQLLSRLLEKRFGPLPNATSELLETAKSEQVEEWGLRMLDAKSLDEVFGGAGDEPAAQLP